MSNRRSFIKGALSMAAVASTASVTRSMASSAPSIPMTGIIYTQENPGKWAKKVGSHLPSVNIDGSKVTVHTDHGMSVKHYIVRHTLVSADGETLGAKTFTPEDEKAISTYTLPEGYKGKLYATSFCNKHDFWLAEAEV
jgi:superoxide reductase